MLSVSRSIGARLASAHQVERTHRCAALDKNVHEKNVQAFKEAHLRGDRPPRRSIAEEGSPSPGNDEQAGSASSRGEMAKVPGRKLRKKTSMGLKKCIACLQVKPISSFSEHPRTRDGHRHKCRECNGQPSNLAPDVIANTHRCPGCREYLPFSSFSRSNWTRTGLATRCRECQKIEKKEYRLRNRVRNATTPLASSKRCSTCGRVKAAEEFYKDLNQPKGLRARCRDCFNEYQTALAESAMLSGVFTEKTCMLCQEVKPLSEFHKDRQKVDGRLSYCRTCFYPIDNNRKKGRRNLLAKISKQPNESP